jgi:Na+/phosphate symporter
MSMGLLCLTVTGTTFSLAFLVGLSMLQHGWLAGLHVSSGPLLSSFFDRIFEPLVAHCAAFIPPWGLFLLGLGVIMVSFSLFDHCLPTMAIKESQLGRTAQLIYRPWVMFVLGSLVTLISMSVSISLGILVPLSERGFIRRENVIPYIMGANVTTFIDSLIAALLLDNPAAFNLIVIQMVSIAFISALILLLVFEPYEQSVLRFVAWGVGSNRHLFLVIIALFLIPLLLVLR